MTTRVQQDEVYAAEGRVRRGMTFASSRDAQAYVDSLRETWWWERFFWQGPARIEVYWRSRGASSVGKWEPENDAGLIEMLPSHRNELIILHEIAHVLADAIHGSHAHDPYFARTYAVLVYCVLGSDAWLELEAGYKEHGVEYLQNE